MAGVPVGQTSCTAVVDVTPRTIREVSFTGRTQEGNLLSSTADRAVLLLGSHYQVSLPVIASDLHQDLQGVHLTHLPHLARTDLLPDSSISGGSADVLEDVERLVVVLGDCRYDVVDNVIIRCLKLLSCDP